MAFNASTLATDVRARTMLPSSTATWPDASILTAADSETLTYIVPIIESVQNEYMVAYYNQAFASGTYQYYRIPSRCIGGRLREVAFVDSAGKLTARQEQCPREDIENRINGYYVEGNYIVLIPDPGTTTDQLQIAYYTRPNALVATTAVATVSSYNSGTKTVTTVATVPGTFSTSQTFDVIKGSSPYEFAAVDLAASVASGTTVTFTTAPTFTPAAGDIIALAGQTSIPQMHDVFHPLLSQATACQILEALGDTEALGNARTKLEKMERDVRTLISQRTDASPSKIVHRNPLWY